MFDARLFSVEMVLPGDAHDKFTAARDSNSLCIRFIGFHEGEIG